MNVSAKKSVGQQICWPKALLTKKIVSQKYFFPKNNYWPKRIVTDLSDKRIVWFNKYLSVKKLMTLLKNKSLPKYDKS